MTQQDYKDSLTRMGVSPNTLQALLNAYEAGTHEAIDALKQRKKALDAKYKRDANIITYAKRKEVTYLLSIVERASPRHPDSLQSGCEVPPSNHHASPDSHGGFVDGSGI
jgi:uncharacterized protein (UPF0305 family)